MGAVPPPLSHRVPVISIKSFKAPYPTLSPSHLRHPIKVGGTSDPVTLPSGMVGVKEGEGRIPGKAPVQGTGGLTSRSAIPDPHPVRGGGCYSQRFPSWRPLLSLW